LHETLSVEDGIHFDDLLSLHGVHHRRPGWRNQNQFDYSMISRRIWKNGRQQYQQLGRRFQTKIALSGQLD